MALLDSATESRGWYQDGLRGWLDQVRQMGELADKKKLKLMVASTVGLALVGIVLWGSLMGSMLPLLLKRLGLDPATSSAPFVATLVDVTGLIIYFSVAFVLLQGTLL